MAVIGLDDTDSREQGMCTTYVAVRLAERLEAAGGEVHGKLLVRLNPAVERKTRGNAALSLHTDLPAAPAARIATDVVSEFAAVDDRTSPGVVVADGAPADVPTAVSQFGRDALREIYDLSDAIRLADEHGWYHTAVRADGAGDHHGYGRIGALAAIGAWNAFDDWTYEHLAYREIDRCGTDRVLDESTVFAAAEAGYPAVWDTVDTVEAEPVCVPNAPGPILFGIRGDSPSACRAVADRIEGEPVDRTGTFKTNQGTDVHVERGAIGSLRDGAGYAVDGVVVGEPDSRRGGHTFFDLAHPDDARAATPVPDPDGAARTIACVAFEPTKRFRDHVRALRPGDSITAVGEHAAGTLKLEKFAVRELVIEELATPTCPECDRTMESAGRTQGYRCRSCDTTSPGRVRRPVDRDLEPGWYEVPPCARRHVAKPLVRGGFDAPVHPAR